MRRYSITLRCALLPNDARNLGHRFDYPGMFWHILAVAYLVGQPPQITKSSRLFRGYPSWDNERKPLVNNWKNIIIRFGRINSAFAGTSNGVAFTAWNLWSGICQAIHMCRLITLAVRHVHRLCSNVMDIASYDTARLGAAPGHPSTYMSRMQFLWAQNG